MKSNLPLRCLLLGFVLVTFGAVAPILMVIDLIPASLLLSFLSYAASVGGLMFGLVGASLYIRGEKR
jgi:hypothetical protein